jgi:hypothetical protein
LKKYVMVGDDSILLNGTTKIDYQYLFFIQFL